MRFRLLCAVLLPLLLVGGGVPSAADAGKATDVKSYLETKNFTSGSFDGTRLNRKGELVLNPAALRQGSDDTGRYNGGSYYYGRWTSRTSPAFFQEAIASWQANTPPGTWLEVELRGKVKGAWTKWYSMGVWHEHDHPFQRHSVRGQGDDDGYVAVDTLVLNKTAAAVQARVTLFTTDAGLTPTFRSYGISFANGKDKAGTVPGTGWSGALDVPMRSQMVYPDGGEIWCSPTSTSMVMAYWARVTGNSRLDQTVPTVVKGVWDYVYDGGGNWPFNTAYAASFGLEGKVTRLSSLAEVEHWTAAGVPVIASIAYKEGELTGTPIPSSNGHLLVIRGFDPQGNVLTNDPAAATDDAVHITYDRQEFERVWLNHSNGTVYLIHPKGWRIPESNGHW